MKVASLERLEEVPRTAMHLKLSRATAVKNHKKYVAKLSSISFYGSLNYDEATPGHGNPPHSFYSNFIVFTCRAWIYDQKYNLELKLKRKAIIIIKT